MIDCKNCIRPCVEFKNGRIVIHGNIVISCEYSSSLPHGSLESIYTVLQERIRTAHKNLSLNFNISQNCLNNLRGVWTKQIFSFISWNAFCKSAKVGNSCIVPLPSINVLRFTDLFDAEASNALRSGLIRRLSQQGVELIMSNPDFVCIADITPEDMAKFNLPITNLSLDTQAALSNAYITIKNSCSYSGLKFGIALKTSLRSDRRYQIAYEGSVLKALIAHLQVRFWDTSFQTNYYAIVASRVSIDDREVLSAPATHSIIDVHALPVKAIDNIFEVNSTEDLEQCMQKIIKASFDMDSLKA